MPALTAFPRGVAGIDQQQRYSGERRFIGDKPPELRERPTVQNGSMHAPSPDPKANSLEVLHDNRPLRAFGFRNDLLRDYVVGVRGKASFFAGKFLQATFGRASVLFLKLSPQASMPVANGANGAADVTLTVRIGSNVDHAEIHSQLLGSFRRRRFHRLTRSRQVEISPAVNQIGLAALGAKQFPLSRATHKRDVQASAGRPDRNPLLLDSPLQNAGIVSYASEWTERASCFPIQFVGVTNFCNTTHYHLCSQTKPLSGWPVRHMVKIVSPELLYVPCLFGEPVAALICLLERREERGSLLFRGLKLHLGCELHLASPPDVFRALDGTLNGFGTDVGGSPDVVRRRPERATPELLSDGGKGLEQRPRSRALQDLDRIGHGDGGRQGNNQVHLVGLDLQRPNAPYPLRANCVQRNAASQHRVAVLRTPHHVVSRLTDCIAIANNFHSYHMLANKRLLPQLKLGGSGASKVL